MPGDTLLTEFDMSQPSPSRARQEVSRILYHRPVPSQNADTPHALCPIQTGLALVTSRFSHWAHPPLVPVNQGEFTPPPPCQLGELNIGILVALPVHNKLST